MVVERIAALASIPSRAGHLERVVESLLPQVDRVCVSFNGYEEIPKWFADLVAAGRAHLRYYPPGDLEDPGDAGKFLFRNVKRADSVYFTCDDDLLYPPDYVATMERHLIELRGAAILSAHGGILPRNPKRWLKGRTMFNCLRQVEELAWVNTIGTGCAVFVPGRKPPTNIFKAPNMADVWVSLWAQYQRIPLGVIPHEEGWIRTLNSRGDDTIYKRVKREGDVQHVKAIARAPWLIHYLEDGHVRSRLPPDRVSIVRHTRRPRSR